MFCKFYKRLCNHCGNCSFAHEVNGQYNYKYSKSAYKRAQKRKVKQNKKEEALCSAEK